MGDVVFKGSSEMLKNYKPEDIRSIEDLKKLPLIEKEDLHRAQGTGP